MCGGDLVGNDVRIEAVSTDSNEKTHSALFIALRGERHDGHSYIAGAAESGHVCAIVDHIPDGEADFMSYIVVGDTVKALGDFAKAYRRLFNVTVVGVTGSVGKTTTKEFIYAVLSGKYNVIKTEGNHNNHIGLPMTILSLKENTRVAVIEMGMSGFGEISGLSKIAAPNIALITNIGTSHIEKLGSREGIAKAKLEIKDGLEEGGILMLYGDEELLGENAALYIGKSEKCDYRVANVIEGANGTVFDLYIGGEKTECITVPTFGEHNVINAAFAYAVGVALGMGEFEIRRGLMTFKSTGMRQSVKACNGRTFIEDCYNASPESMIASLKVLSAMAKRQNKRSVAVLGNMLELGSYAPEGHRRVGAAAAYERIDMLITFGMDARYIASAAVEFGIERERVFVFPDISDVQTIGKFILQNTDDRDIILFKASRGIRLERVIDFVKNN